MKYMYYEVFKLLIERFGSVDKLWNLSATNIKECSFLNSYIVEDITNKEIRKSLDKYLAYMIKNNIKLVNYFQKDYPIKLRFIKNPPIVLFYKGSMIDINNESVSIVGSRNCSEYGRKCARFFTSQLASYGINIISGLAIGIDTIAHSEALNGGAKTVAVIGNGLDSIYPKENYYLAEKILSNKGIIISEFVMGTKPEKTNFPRRNRLISGLSNATIVVEAGKRSGSLITANFAINQGREVWVVPGNIFSKNSEGCNELIRDGANVLTDIKDIIRTSKSVKRSNT